MIPRLLKTRFPFFVLTGSFLCASIALGIDLGKPFRELTQQEADARTQRARRLRDERRREIQLRRERISQLRNQISQRQASARAATAEFEKNKASLKSQVNLQLQEIDQDLVTLRRDLASVTEIAQVLDSAAPPIEEALQRVISIEEGLYAALQLGEALTRTQVPTTVWRTVLHDLQKQATHIDPWLRWTQLRARTFWQSSPDLVDPRLISSLRRSHQNFSDQARLLEIPATLAALHRLRAHVGTVHALLVTHAANYRNLRTQYEELSNRL